MFAKAQRVHFIGIGGIGMSGIAEILLTLGYAVSGSDLRSSTVTDRLASLGASIFEGHAAANVIGAGVVVASSAIHDTNPETVEAKRRKIPVIPRAEMLAELMRLKYGIAIAGMHGKTTTTSLIASVLSAGGLDPTLVVGGRVDTLGSNARLGRSQYLVAEADESDRSFLKLSPILAVVTNLDREHMDCYRDMHDVEDAFVEFMDRVPFYGAVIACGDDPLLTALLPRVRRRVFTYGTGTHCDYVVRLLPAILDAPPVQALLSATPGDAAPAETMPVRSRFEIVADGTVLGPFALLVPGMHNVLNATAAVAIAHQLEISSENMVQGLRQFRGVDRRFQLRGCVRNIAVIDDYGHHPTEIRATLRAALDCHYRQIHVIFQPHRFTRTRDLMAEFAQAFAGAASVEVLDIYPASEPPIPGIDAQALVAAAAQPDMQHARDFQEAADRIVARAQEGDAILTLGAGNVVQVAPLVLAALYARYAPAAAGSIQTTADVSA
jgi:UDP-N-acetylmuramate--alanine ligase